MYENVIVNMAKEHEDFMAKWKKDTTKQHVRVTLSGEAAEFIAERAHDDFGLGQSAVSLEISYLILVAKDCIEKQATKSQ